MLKFFVSYLVLTGLYQLFLTHNSTKSLNTPDIITQKVATQTVEIGKILGVNINTQTHDKEPSMKLFINNNYVARVVEGCNSISVLILFWAFIIAFSGKIGETIVFGILGSFLIYLINLIRILILTIAINHYPTKTEFLHQIVFPSIIYGFTFLLWIIWVKRVEKQQLKLTDSNE